jgi:hypothetical protein
VHVATTVAADTVTGRHADLASADLVPDQHLVDAGDVRVDHILDAHPGHGIELVGSLPPDSGFKALDEHGFDFTPFAIDWDRKQVTCPNGKTSRTWRQTTACRSSRRPSVRRLHPCPDRVRCTRSPVLARHLTFRPRTQCQTQRQLRAEQATAAAPF